MMYGAVLAGSPFARHQALYRRVFVIGERPVKRVFEGQDGCRRALELLQCGLPLGLLLAPLLVARARFHSSLH